MKNIFVKFISCFIFCAIILGVPAMSSVQAYVCPHCDSCCCCGSEVHVSDENGLRYALEEACCGTVIVLDADIYLYAPVEISPCVTVCKNGHRLMKYYKIEHGYYAVEPVVLYPNTVVYENVWEPTWIETGYEEVF